MKWLLNVTPDEYHELRARAEKVCMKHEMKMPTHPTAVRMLVREAMREVLAPFECARNNDVLDGEVMVRVVTKPGINCRIRPLDHEYPMQQYKQVPWCLPNLGPVVGG